MTPKVGVRLQSSQTVKRTPPPRNAARLVTVLWFPASAPPSKWFSYVAYPMPPSTTGLHRIPVFPIGRLAATSPRPVTRVIERSVSLTLDA